MNTFSRKLGLGAMLLALLAGSASAQSRVATVDLQKVFDKYWKTEQAVAGLKVRAAEMEKSHDELIDSYKKAKTEYQKLLQDANDQAVSADERDKRKKSAEDRLVEIKKTEDDINQFERQATAALNEQKARMRRNILDEIKLTIGSKAKAGGYSAVIDSGAQTYVADPSGPYYTPALLYTSDENDLTDSVIAQLNVGAPVAAPGTEDRKEPPKGGKK